jgi:hypothetical protein
VVVVFGDVVVVAIGTVAVVEVAATVVDVDEVGAVTNGLMMFDDASVVVVTRLDTVNRSGVFPPPPKAIEPKMKTAIAPTALLTTIHRRLRIA